MYIIDDAGWRSMIAHDGWPMASHVGFCHNGSLLRRSCIGQQEHICKGRPELRKIANTIKGKHFDGKHLPLAVLAIEWKEKTCVFEAGAG